MTASREARAAGLRAPHRTTADTDPGLAGGGPAASATDITQACDRLLDKVDSAFLDCVSDDVALLLAHAGEPDPRAALAERWRFDLRPGDGPPAVALPAPDVEDRVTRRTGWRLEWREVTDARDAVRAWHDQLRRGRPVLVVGDAFHLPWVPYFDHEHMDHGFVVSGIDGTVLHVVDPYDNVTEWGKAAPLSTTAVLTEVAPALTGGRWAVLERVGPGQPAHVPDLITANAGAIASAAVDGGAIARFLAGHRPLDGVTLPVLVLQTWLLARDRALHGLWLADNRSALHDLGVPGFADEFAQRVVSAWRAAEQATYLALRRVRRGRAAPQSALEAVAAVLHDEADLARRLLDHRPQPPTNRSRS